MSDVLFTEVLGAGLIWLKNLNCLQRYNGNRKIYESITKLYTMIGTSMASEGGRKE